MTETEKAYIAGIMDGEGHMSIQYQKAYISKNGHHGASYKATIAITGTHKPMLEWVQARIGGKLYAKKNGMPDGRWKDNWQLVITRKDDVLAVLDLLEPYLIIKASHVFWLRKFLSRELYTRHSPVVQECYEAVKRLNIRGISRYQLTLC